MKFIKSLEEFGKIVDEGHINSIKIQSKYPLTIESLKLIELTHMIKEGRVYLWD